MSSDLFDADYFERGIESGKSCYQNYRWMPEKTIAMAMVMIDYLGIIRIATVLDFGCAKGYLVKALRILGRKAYGVDISKYAIDNCDPDVKDYCRLNTPDGCCFNFCIAKDVFEHVPETSLLDTLNSIKAWTLFAVIPLGDNGKFRAPSNDMDVTHVTCRPEAWWLEIFEKSEWTLESFSFKIKGIKDSYYERYPKAHGFFTLRRY